MLGCAILAAVASGAFPDIATAVRAMVHTDRVVSPNPEAVQHYQKHYEQYIQLYPSLKQLFHKSIRKCNVPLDPIPSVKVADCQKQEIIISASILAADFSRLASEVSVALSSGADWIHVDMFDGTLVNNWTIGPPVLKALKASSPPGTFFDCHLAVSVRERRWI